MRIGISLSSTRTTDDHAAGAASIVSRARAAEAADLDSVTLGDRHAVPVPYYQNVPMLGRVIAELSPQRQVGCLFLLPLWHPVLVAEQVGTLASMVARPFVVQTGIGAGAQQFDAMGVSLRTRGADLEESIRIIDALLAGESVSSERFGLIDASIAPRPPHGIEWWIGAGVDKALRRAATLGDAWYTNPHFTPEQLAPMVQRYTEFCAETGRPGRVAMRKDVLLLEDSRAADEAGNAILQSGYRGMQRENVLVGSPERALEELAAFAAVGVDDVIVRCMSADDDLAIETIRLCGELRRQLR